MRETVTLAQVEELATRLPLAERLQLISHVCEQLRVSLPSLAVEQEAPGQKGREQSGKLDQWLAECDAVAELWTGEFDAAEDLRHMREER
jgi:hypothetical protein